MAYPLHVVIESIYKLGLEYQCFPKPGLFSKTINNYSTDQRFALVHIDCDLYEGAKQALEFIRVVPP